MQRSKNVQLVLDILRDEVCGDVRSAMKKLTSDYSMTWVYQRGAELFPSTKKNVKAGMEEIYPIKGRVYDIKNIAEGKDLVMVELVESYPDPKTKKVYRTPLVLVLELKGGKIRTGRHYCDPQLSFAGLSKAQVAKVYKHPSNKLVIS